MKLRYTRGAVEDLDAILDYIAAHAPPQAAERVRRAIERRIHRLLRFPHLGRRTADPTIRRMTAIPYPYLIFYEATKTEIIIYAVRHAARDPSSMPGST